MTNSRVVLFDLDGTITDSAPGIIACIRYALADLGLEGPDDNAMRSFLGPPLVDTFINHFGVTPARLPGAARNSRRPPNPGCNYRYRDFEAHRIGNPHPDPLWARRLFHLYRWRRNAWCPPT
ncbi:MAG: HAD hydrolase-like protein [Actinobacteria bacterium]|nr:HAD hydrolase-like protein [Actinomycetota bacterium]